jgi:hypothetical protein
VAVGDVNGDGFADIITAPGAGAGPLVRVWSGNDYNEVEGRFVYRTSFTGGVYVAVGDLDGDGFDEIVTAPGAGGAPLVKVFDGETGRLVSSFMAFSSSFTGGVRVAVGDVNGDGIPDIIVGAGAGGGPQIHVYDGTDRHLLFSFLAYRSSFNGGVFVAAGDVNGDGTADIITGVGGGAGPLVKGFSVVDPAVGVALVTQFFAYRSSFTGGVRVAAGDVNGDGVAEIITASGPGGGPHIKVFDGKSGDLLSDLWPYSRSNTGGVFVAFGATVPVPGP